MSYIDDVRREVAAHCPALLYEWLPDGKQVSGYYKCASLQGGRGDSFSVNLKTGQWADWAGPSDHRGGDLVSLYAAIKGVPYKEALASLADDFGVKRPKRATSRPGDWRAVTPVPSASLTFDASGNPELPELPSLKGLAPTMFWTYYDRDGGVLMFVARFDPPEGRKFFRPITLWRHKEGAVEWRAQALPAPRPLFNLPTIGLQPNKVIVCEGEKAAVAAARLLPDWCVTTWPGGAQNVRHAEWEPLRAMNNARIVLWPDNDKPGEEAMSAVLAQLPQQVEVIMPDPRWPGGYDLADLERDGWTTEQTESWISSHALKAKRPEQEERIEVHLDGFDVHADMLAIFDAVRQAEAPVFAAIDGVRVVSRNIHGHPENHVISPENLGATLTYYLAPKRHHPQLKMAVDAEIPVKLARYVIENAARGLYPLKGAYATPVRLPDGRMVERSGYSKESGLWLEVPEDYDPEMAIGDAQALWDDLTADFPFESEADRTAALAFALTPILRPSIDGPVPLFRFEAPIVGTGKTMLCYTLAQLSMPGVGLTGMDKDEPEVRKQLTSSLLESPVLHIFDDVENLDTEALKRLLTARSWNDRALGTNRMVNVPIRTVFAITVNNPTMMEGMLRRTVRVRLNARIEAPASRSGFRHHDMSSYVLKNRGKLVSALCAMIRDAEGYAPTSIPVMGSFEAWVRTLAPIVEANGFSDFLATAKEDQESSLSQEDEAIREFIAAWAEEFAGSPVTVAALCPVASKIGGFPGRRTPDGAISPKSLGKTLTSLRGAVKCGLTIEKRGHTEKGAEWKLTGDIQQKESLF